MTAQEFYRKYPVADASLKAFLVGGGVSALSALVSDIIEAKRQRDRKNDRERARETEDTVVLNLGRRDEGGRKAAGADSAERCDGNGSHSSVSRVEPAVEGREIRYSGDGCQPRTSDGKYSTFGKAAGSRGAMFSKSGQDESKYRNYGTFWDLLSSVGAGGGSDPDWTWAQSPGKALQIAAVPVAALGGYYVVQALHKKLEEKRLKKQIAAAQKEYIDLLGGKGVKSAEAFSRMFLFDGPCLAEKTAQDASSGLSLASVKNGLKSLWGGITAIPGAASDALKGLNDTSKIVATDALAAMFLTTGASAWLTHKILAKYFDNKKEKEEDPRRVTRVVVKSGSADGCPLPSEFGVPKIMIKCADGEFEVSTEDFLCTVEVMRDCIRDSSPMRKSAVSADKVKMFYDLLEACAARVNEKIGKNPGLAASVGANGVSPRDVAEAVMNGSGPVYDILSSDPVFNHEGFRKGLQSLQEGLGEGRSLLTEIDNIPHIMSGREEGMTPELYQHAIRRYGKNEFGLNYDYDPSLDYRLAGAIGDTDEGVVKNMILERMKNDPRQWFGLIGSEQNADFRNAVLQRKFQEMQNEGGVAGTLFKVPVLGDLLKRLATWYYTKTGMGNRALMGRIAEHVGIPSDQRESFLNGYRTLEGGGWAEVNDGGAPGGNSSVPPAPAPAPGGGTAAEAAGSPAPAARAGDTHAALAPSPNSRPVPAAGAKVPGTSS